MHSNTILALVIVLLFIMAFLAWLLVSLAALTEDLGLAASIIIPGTIVFGFWWLVAYRLYQCPSNTIGEDLGLCSKSSA